MLDGGCAQQAIDRLPSRALVKRKATHIEADEQPEGKRSKSLLDHSFSSAVRTGHVSPLLELLQQGNSGVSVEGSTPLLPLFTRTVPMAGGKKSKSERRLKAKAKMQRVEARIQRLTAAMCHTREQEQQATLLAQHMAKQAEAAAQLASQQQMQQMQQQQQMAQEAAAMVVESGAFSPLLFGESAPLFMFPSPLSCASLPSLLANSPALVGATSTCEAARSRTAAATGVADFSSSSAAETDSGTSSPAVEQHTHAAESGGRGASPVRSLEEHIGSLSPTTLRTLHCAEQSQLLRQLQHSLLCLEEEVEWSERTEVPQALRFLDESEAGVAGLQRDKESARSTLLCMMQEAAGKEVSAEHIHSSLHSLSDKLLAKSRAQQGAFRLMA